jgi:predicted  nucleic acid-binding Zn-ribbon protein
MDSSSVLLALEEQKKWRERRKRIRDRIRHLERRRAALRRELEGVRSMIEEFGQRLRDQIGSSGVAVFPPTTPGR